MYYILDELFLESISGHTEYLLLSDAVKAAREYAKRTGQKVIVVKIVKTVEP